MPHGISTNRHCTAIGACLRAADKTFVVRYYSAHTQQAQKRLLRDEATSVAAAGLAVGAVYQDRARELSDFGATRGVADGRAAFAAAAEVGQPRGSAIYFAVDSDFSTSEIEAAVLPYFQGVAQGLRAAADSAAPPYRIGVYGSGLTCQLVKENEALAQLSWLAMSSGWRGTSDYTTWDMRQSAPSGVLCTLGADGWEANESRGDAGLFAPVGSVQPGTVPPVASVLMQVTATELFLRTMPSTKGNTPLMRLHQTQVVEVLGDALPPFKRVRVQVQGQPVEGYASGKFLAPLVPGALPAVGPAVGGAVFVPKGVHFRPDDPQSRRDSTAARAQPLGETPRPARRPGGTLEQRLADLNGIVDWLDVEDSARYRPQPDKTFCNIYAADFCFLAGAYLPRTWWTASTLARMAAGEPAPQPLYGQNIRELRADDLLAWLQEWGPAFGWRPTFDLDALQQRANSGGVGLICADRATEGRPGHIVAVVPETDLVRAVRDADGRVQRPVQSQAGASNHARIVHATRWWDDELKFRDRGFFIHD